MGKEPDLIHRAISLPVVGPIGRTWDEFGEACREAWNDSTALANWSATTLYAKDVRRKPADKKLKPMPSIYLYGLAKQSFWGWKAWEGCYSSAQSLMRGIEKKYRASRIGLLWHGSESLPTYRHPHPYPVHNDCWTARIEGKQQTVEFNLKGQKWTLLLRSGPEFVRQMALFRQLVGGGFEQAELSLYRQGFRDKHTMVKLVAKLPKPAIKTGHTVIVRTDPNAFWVSERVGGNWIVNADHVRRWIDSHRCYLQRIAEDTKHEKRWSDQMRDNINKARAIRCEKHEDRIDTWCHQATAMLTAWAERQGAAVLVYDDSKQEYLPRFPWFKLRSYLSYKLEAAGIEFVHGGRNEEVA